MRTGASRPAAMAAAKRKFDQALLSLDDAINTSSPTVRPSPPKIRRSIYSALSIHGRNQQPQSLCTATPHLSAIISRSQRKKLLPSPLPSPPPLPSTSEYRPSSLPCFLARLATFKLSTYANKPPEIDAVAAAKSGWTNQGKDRLVCGLCHASFALASCKGLPSEAAAALLEKQSTGLVENHRDGCPWKTRQCHASIYRISLKTPSTMVNDILSNAEAIDSVMDESLVVEHPLNENLLQSLLSTFSSAQQHIPSQASLLVALFGWKVAPAQPRQRLSSVTSFSRPTTPSLSKPVNAFDGQSASVSRPGTPIRPSRRPTSDVTSMATPPKQTISASAPPLARSQVSADHRLTTPDPSDSISVALRCSTPHGERTVALDSVGINPAIFCELCQRKVGLWAYASQIEQTSKSNPSARQRKKTLNVLAEHRPHCPYVTKSTEIPFLPSYIDVPSPGISTPTPVEGWRAVASVVLRYRISERLRDRVPGVLSEREDSHQDDVLQAMVQGVKTHGGRNILKYIQGALGS